MANVSVYLKDLKNVSGFEVMARGTCPETGKENRILSAVVMGETFHRKIDRIDWAEDIYQPFMAGETNNPAIIALHDPSLKDG